MGGVIKCLYLFYDFVIITFDFCFWPHVLLLTLLEMLTVKVHLHYSGKTSILHCTFCVGWHNYCFSGNFSWCWTMRSSLPTLPTVLMLLPAEHYVLEIYLVLIFHQQFVFLLILPVRQMNAAIICAHQGQGLVIFWS